LASIAASNRNATAVVMPDPAADPS